MNLNTSFDQSVQCITFENAEPEMITVEPKVQNLLSPHQPSQLSKIKTESQYGLGLSPRAYIRKTVNGLVRNMTQDELASTMEYIQQLLMILSDANQTTTICFKKFWSDNSTEGQIDQLHSTFCSLVTLIGLKTHEDQYFANDREEVLRRALLLEKLVKVLQIYYQPLHSSEIKPNMEYCYNGEQVTKKAQTILKIKNYDNLEDEDGTLLTISEKSFRFKRNDVMLMGDFNLVVNKEQGSEQLKELLNEINERVLNGEDIMLISAGTTGSGKSETLFKNSHQKFERVDRLDEDLAVHILDSILQLNVEPIADEENQRSISLEGEYIQIFNENLLDLLKKKEKEDDLEIEQKTNLEWLLEPNSDNLIKLPIEDKSSVRKLIRRVHKNKSLLTLQDKIFERRSVYLMRCTYKIRVGEEEKTGSIVFCELPGTEKLTPNEKVSLNNMKIENNLLTSKTEFDEFCLQGYPTKKKYFIGYENHLLIPKTSSVLMRVLNPEFVRKCEMIMFSHLSLSRQSYEENILFFRSIKPFNESIAIQKWDKDNVVTDITLFCLVDEFEKIRKILTKPNPSRVGKQIALQKACDSLEELEIFAGDIIINGFRVGASSIDDTLANLEQYIAKFKDIETQAHSEQQATASIEQRRKTPPKSLNDLPSPMGFSKRQGLAAPIAKSHSSPLKPLKSANLKPKSLVHQDSLSEFIEEISETDLLVYRSRLISEGRCTVCTLKNCQNHSQIPSISQMSSSNKLDSIVLRMKDYSDTQSISIRGSSRERARFSRQSNKPKENLYGPTDLMESNLVKTNTFYNPHRRTVRKPDSTLNDSFALRELNSQHLDSETRSRDSEIKSRVLENQTVIGNFLSTKTGTLYNNGSAAQETTKLEDMDNKKLIQQLKLEDYHERKILAQIQLLKDQKTTEILSKKENEVQDEKKKKYMDGQKKRLEEMRKLKVEEERKEKEDLEKRLRREAKKKLQTDTYYKKIKQKVQAYKTQKEMELLYEALQEEQQRLEDERKETITNTTKQTIRPNDETLSAVSKKEERLKSMERKHEIIKAIYQPPQTAPVVAPRKISSNSMEYTEGSFESLEEQEEEAIEEEIEV